MAGPRFASFLESTLEQLLCKHRELLVAQFREVLKDDRVGPPVPSSRPPALAPMPGPEAPRLKESESFLAKVKTKAGLDKPRAIATLGVVEAALLDQLTDDVTPAGKRTFSSPQMLRTVQPDPPMPLGPTEEPSSLSMGFPGQQIMPAPHESQDSLSSQPRQNHPGVGVPPKRKQHQLLRLLARILAAMASSFDPFLRQCTTMSSPGLVPSLTVRLPKLRSSLRRQRVCVMSLLLRRTSKQRPWLKQRLSGKSSVKPRSCKKRWKLKLSSCKNAERR